MRDKKGNMYIGIIIAIILGVVMLGVVYSMVIDRTETFSDTDDLINYTSGNLALSGVDSDFGDIASTTTIINSTGGNSMTSLCSLLSSENVAYIECDESYGNATYGALINVSYTYEKVGYYSGSSTRTIGVLIPVLLAVAILSLIAFAFMGKRD